MSKPTGFCSSCEKVVEYEATATTPRMWKCCNCWHYIDQKTMDASHDLHAELIAHEEQRNAIIAANR